SFNPRGIDTHFTVVLLDTIRYTCRDLGFTNPTITYRRPHEENSFSGPSVSVTYRRPHRGRIHLVVSGTKPPSSLWAGRNHHPHIILVALSKRDKITILARHNIQSFFSLLNQFNRHIPSFTYAHHLFIKTS
ncbi:hypothetical protein PIB30_100156, partial [Stylosanthes scabra]|nr:hypothetical protein [Stylosanthes scabra]